MDLLSIYDEPKRCRDKHNYQDFYICLKEHLKRRINDDKEKLLSLKMLCQEEADPEGLNLTVSGTALIMAIGAILLNFYSVTIVSSIVMTIVMLGFIIWMAEVLIRANEKRKKYNKILFVLNELEKEISDSNKPNKS